MAEFFLELFSEEIPAGLQKNLREKLLEEFQKFFLEKSIKSKKSFQHITLNMQTQKIYLRFLIFLKVKLNH